MTRGQYWTLCAALSLSVVAVLVAHRAAVAVGVSPPWLQRKGKIAVM